jgi:molybdopterin-guanine dinucleotide biosynthesis protein A
MKRAGFVLVGGQSSRMGRDKALLPSQSGPLVLEIADRVAAAVGNVVLVGRRAVYRDRLGLDCLDDVRPGYGPLSGIHAALHSGRGDYNLILACDMPGIPEELLVSLFETAKARSARCVVTVDAAGEVHPLCAVYHRDALDAVEHAMDASRLCLMDLLRDLDALRFESPLTVQNCNTPAEWTAFQRS